MKVWSAASGSELLALPGHSAEVTGVSFTPDDKHLVTSSRDGSLRIYALDKDFLRLCDRPCRDLQRALLPPIDVPVHYIALPPGPLALTWGRVDGERLTGGQGAG